ncbi:response regulator transcription factor [Gordonia sp. (in: high G+C Gram-positive bacteria)]|uniref:response regulator transcription factor n=1 Tax=Gordonia sp. (in: high G+C Gram-positive bacteria) TaxID=84139 RepID=UPI00169E85B9|nr:response regulator transcription factor [Gordonia sp. (in: high G+C Gram-positive bacteria)]NLG46150.1 response regulator transcription factor [Gordonia sp. (in: high G+C Gram-positive bacteria)]
MDLLLLTEEPTADGALGSLSLLSHRVTVLPADTSSLVRLGDPHVILMDARNDLAAAKTLCKLVADTGTAPIIAIVGEGGLVVVNAEWGIDDFLMPSTGPGELEARLRMVSSRTVHTDDQPADKVTLGELVIDESTYTARLRGRPIDLTYKEFELLKYLAQNAGRVYTRAQLLHEVWGYDYFGGTRTVDVHVRRLRAKLGSDHESLIGTVRNVGYKAVKPPRRAGGDAPSKDSPDFDDAADTVEGDD